MDVVPGGEVALGSDKFGIDLLNTRQKDCVYSMYSSVDEAANHEINRLSVEEGITATCKPGCFYCCGQHILTNIAEAQALAQYIKDEFSQDQIEDLRIRTQQWHEWDETRRGLHDANPIDEKFSLSNFQYCPVLVEGKCSAYPMRPLICRTHFVSSEPPACRPFYDPQSVESNPVPLKSVMAATNPFSLRVKDHIENAGLNYNGSIMLLPHWLAIEMNWDFALSLQFG